MTGCTTVRIAAFALSAGVASLASPVEAQTVSGPAFEVDVTLSPAAAARLANLRETIIVDAEFFGVPASPKLLAATHGRLDLAPERKIELSGAGVAHFPAPGYDASKLKLVQGGTAEVAIEGFSGRHSGPNNFLDCDYFEDAVQLAASRPVQMHCKLIGEP
jgi:hypothetical protein